MRVLRVSHSATVTEWRGRERALRALGLEVTVLAAREWHAGGTEVRLRAGDEAGAIPVRTWGRHPALFVYDPRPLWRALGQTWDVLDVHEEPFALATAEVLLLRALRRRRPPVVLYTAQNIRKRYPPPFRWLERWALRTAAGISACNTDAAAIVVDKGFAGEPRVIPLGIDPDALAATAGARGGRRAKGPVTVGLLGRLVPEKGIDTLLLALALDPRLRARIAGSGPMAHSIPRRASDLGIADRVELVGPVAPDQVAEFYRSVDVVAVPSTANARWTEQFGRVAVEAMACGVPVVVSDAGALPEVVGDAGIVVPQRHPVELAAALWSAARERADELRAAGTARARECSWDAVARDYVRLYRSVRHEPTAPTEPAGPTGGDVPGVEVVVVAYGSPSLVRSALAPLTGLPVTVVDNSSLAEIAAIAREFGARYLDAGRNGGFGAGVNVALAHRSVPGADVLLLNPDARIAPEAIAALQRHLRASRDLASVAPTQTDDAGRAARVAWPFPSPLNAWLEAVGLARWQRGPRYVIGSVLLLRAEALDQVGPFDERFFLYAEETDWAYRAHRLGWRHELAPEVAAVHLGAATSSDPRRRDAHFYGSQERYLRKHFGTAGWQTARVANWAGAMVRSVVLRGERGRAARRRAAVYRLGPMRVESRFRETAP